MIAMGIWKYWIGAIVITALIVLGYLGLEKVRDRLRPERAAARAELQRLNGELQELRRRLAEQKKMLADSPTAEQATRLAAAGQFPADQLEAYRTARESAEAMAERVLPALIRDKEAEIAACGRKAK